MIFDELRMQLLPTQSEGILRVAIDYREVDLEILLTAMGLGVKIEIRLKELGY